MMLFCKCYSDVPRRSPMSCKFKADVTKTIADVLQDLYRSQKDITAQVNQSECFASSQQNSQPICRYFASSKQTSQRQSPVYCKILIDVTKTIADVLQDLYRSHRQSPMFCKFEADVTKTIADALQGLYRRHKDNRRCIAKS